VEKYQIGTRPTFTSTFVSSTGVATTPSAGSFALAKPDGTTLTYALTNSSVTVAGVGILKFTPPAAFDIPGIWAIRTTGTTDIVTAWEEEFEVLPSAFVAEAGRYCKTSDLLIGDLTVSPATLNQLVNAAADEMDGEIGEHYELPLPIGSMPQHVVLRLKQCNVLIATGRFIMSQAVASEDTSTNAYGMSMLREGQGILKAICTFQFDLIGAALRNPPSTGNAPAIVQGDAVSGVDAFYRYTGVIGGQRNAPIGRDFWSPG
jgi:hypothetical protein